MRDRLAQVRHHLHTRLRDQSGMSTAEYAVGTIAAVAFAGVLLKVLTSDGVREAIDGIISRALS